MFCSGFVLIRRLGQNFHQFFLVKFSLGAQAAAFGTGSFAAPVELAHFWSPLEMGLVMCAHSLRAPFRLLLFLLLSLVARLSCSDPHALLWSGVPPIVSAILAAWLVSNIFGGPLGIWSSLVQILLDAFIFASSLWLVLLPGACHEKRAIELASVMVFVSWYNFVVVGVSVAWKYCGTRDNLQRADREL